MNSTLKLCTARGISTVASPHPKLLTANQIQSVHCKPQFPSLLKPTRFNCGQFTRFSVFLMDSAYRNANSVCFRTIKPPLFNFFTVIRWRPWRGGLPDGDITVEKTDVGENIDDYETQQNEAPQEGSFVDNLQFLKFLEEFDIKLLQAEYLDDESLIAMMSTFSGGAVALWLAAAFVGAVDSIPLVPKVLELVGLGYTIWFSSRYLIFKENRDELFATVEQIKQQVLGSKDK
ncbi:hypothetical protein SASPL_141264 [Salvia splendens]|uniref:Cyanobacterial aminoacyl-tRNA synthetase CAAD domain-containing protein n=1 Tax=Salvia splendens TaxID=180675 RepID=A0A8X8ZD93_SALSN|nr:hypothetical protein SASPL_141264 [Salvia splendens]